MASRVTTEPARQRSVFINCPFDQSYQPLLRAACYTILACGWVPRCALDFSDSGEVRFARIVDLIAACDFSLHDVSRVEAPKGLPRFNMPLELGADLGLRLRGPSPQRRRKLLILDAVAHRYDKTLSDISGAGALSTDYPHYESIAPDIIEQLRLDKHADLQHRDYVAVVRRALPLIAEASASVATARLQSARAALPSRTP